MTNNEHIRLSELKNYISEENINFMKFKMSQDKISTFTHIFINTMVVRYRTQ